MKAPRNRPAVEAALSDTWRLAIAEVCSLLGVPRDRWESLPGVRGIAETLALYRRADELRTKHGYGIERSLLEAGGELGLDPDTVSRRLRDWLRAAFADAA
jgi:hypothetical protein